MLPSVKITREKGTSVQPIPSIRWYGTKYIRLRVPEPISNLVILSQVATVALKAMYLESQARIQAGTFPDNIFVIFLGNPREMSKECLKIGHDCFLSHSVQSKHIVH
jgi:hypothetical protein